MSITTERATIRRWGDVQHALAGSDDAQACQCFWPVATAAEWDSTSTDDRRRRLHDEIEGGRPPGLVAYVDGQSAGWIRVGPRVAQVSVLASDEIASATEEPVDADDVWAVTCFVLRGEHRGQGLAAELLRDAVDYARESGARSIEAYPLDAAEGAHGAVDLFQGALSTFLAAGFRQVTPLARGRVLVVRELT